jgi:hypothetical protein
LEIRTPAAAAAAEPAVGAMCMKSPRLKPRAEVGRRFGPGGDEATEPMEDELEAFGPTDVVASDGGGGGRESGKVVSKSPVACRGLCPDRASTGNPGPFSSTGVGTISDTRGLRARVLVWRPSPPGVPPV